MAKFRLLFGQHVGKDEYGEPHTYLPGDIIETDTDLVEKFGVGKFQPMEGQITVLPHDSGAINRFPGGQVSEGHQVTSGEQQLRETVQLSQQQLAEQLRTGQGAKRGSPPAPSQRDEVGSEDTADEKPTGVAVPSKPSAPNPAVRKEESKPSVPGLVKKPDFDKMSLNELNKYADEEEIDLKGHKSRADILRIIKESDRESSKN